MATLAELLANVEKIKGFVQVYLDVPELTEKQKNALKVDLVRLSQNLDALAAYTEAPARAAAVPVTADAPPLADLEAPFRPSTAIFAEWARAWFAETFPGVDTIDPVVVAPKAAEQGVLAEVSASGLLGYPAPIGPYADLGDWSLYTGWAQHYGDGGSNTAFVWVLGQLVREVANGDAWLLAKEAGIDA